MAEKKNSDVFCVPKPNHSNPFLREEFSNILNEINDLNLEKTSSDYKENQLKYESLTKEAIRIIEEYSSVALAELSPEMTFENDPYEHDRHLKNYKEILEVIREQGGSKIYALTNEMREIKLNKQIDKETKLEILEQDKISMKEAKAVKNLFAKIEKAFINASANYNWLIGKYYYNNVSAHEREIFNARSLEIKAKKDAEEARNNQSTKTLSDEYSAVKTNLIDRQKKAIDEKEKAAIKKELDLVSDKYKHEQRANTVIHRSALGDIRTEENEARDEYKNSRFNAFLSKSGYAAIVRDDGFNFKENFEKKVKTYAYNFNLSKFLMSNALYFVIIFFFIITVIVSGGSLLSFNNLLAILGQSSTKLFFSLGVAGLILIGGTDLSIGRMTGMAASLTCLILARNPSVLHGITFDFTSMPMGLRVVIALVVTIIATTLFSTIAGFFTAKFKMHPFITTLSTQLVIFGLFMIAFSAVPAFNMDSEVKSAITGYRNLMLVLYAAIATVIMWFIWNKTKFGKYMYAVGGNQEAASVSGINVFVVTLGIFILAGIMYGFGGFLEAARVGSANPNTGSGTELDAIAACVVGGISFSGGIGKIRGAVIGTIIFTGLTYCLTYIGLDTNIQFIFKGIIIMAAVCLDSLKYLKKR